MHHLLHEQSQYYGEAMQPSVLMRGVLTKLTNKNNQLPNLQEKDDFFSQALQRWMIISIKHSIFMGVLI